MTSGRLANLRRNPATHRSACRYEFALLHRGRSRGLGVTQVKFANGLDIVLDGLATRLPREGRGF